MKRINSVLTLAASLLLFALARPQAYAFTHPCAPTTLQELDAIKANLDKEPWKSGYAALAADGKSQLGYVMGGPFEVVKRNPNENLWPWRNDMVAFYNLSRMWYFTGNPAYAQKAHDIIIAWATTHKVFGGNESGLDLGDYALCYGNGASILRGTWSGWTQQDTLTVQNYFRNVLWPATASPYNISGPANKGSLNLVAGAVIAVFCDDTAMFNHVVDVFRNYPGSGLPNILPTGQMGETGRDMGHGFNDLLARTVTAEILWKQGVDVFSESDNRLLAAGEYHARNTSTSDTPFVPYGTVDYNYYQNSGALLSQDRITYYLLQNAYKNRLGLPTPWIDQKIREAGVHGGNFMFAKTVDFSTATPPPADPRPAVSPASSGLTLTTLGTQTTGRSASYANGVWTVTGLGNGAWSDASDDGQFAYTAMTGDCAMVAQVTSVTYSGSQNGKMGLMIRDNLISTVSQRAWISITPTASSGNLIEARATGWTVTWGGANWARRSQGLPLPLPYWLKIERKNNVITSYTSQDGTSWSPTISSDYGNLPSTVYVGLFVSSGNTTPNTATFANLAFTGGTGGLVTTPAAPAAMLASGSGKAITLRWLPSFGATGYDLLRSTTSGSGYTVIASDLTAAKTSYVDTSAAAGTTYYYVARAKNSAGTSGNSPEFSAARLPAPLINLALTGGTVNDSANNSANAANAFDDNFGTQWFYGQTTGWLQYDFGANSAQIVKSYTLVSAPDFDTRDPKDWEFQGSNDGTIWTTLDAQANQTFAFRSYLRSFPLSNPTAYRYYRLNITSNNGDASFVHVGGLGLWGDSGHVIADGGYAVASRNTNKVMDVTGTANGTPVVQQTFAGGDTQQWTLAWQGNGQYRATSVATSGTKAIDNGGTSTAGANLVIQPTSAATSQLWKLVPDNDGFFRVESVNSGLVAGVSGGSTANGANITQDSYSGSSSQQWMPGIAVARQPIPAAPTGLTGSAVSISQINLSWTASSGAVSYQLKRSTTNGGPYTAVSVPVNTTSYSDTGLTSSTTYYYVVSAINGSGESANSAQASATTLTAPPDAPASPTAILGTSGVTVSWTASGGATSYTVQRATTSGGPYTTVATGITGTSYTDTSISHDTTYYYVVIAINANGASPASTELTVGAGTLVAQLKFDETGGTIATDSSGRGQNATLVNGANFAAAGMVESGLNLPGTAAQHATLPSGIVSGLTDFTIATWIKVNSFSTWARIFDFGTGTNSNMFLAAQGSAGAGRPRFSIRTTSVAEQVIDSSVALTAGTWAHVAVTRSGSTVSIYINGSLAGSGTLTASPADLGFTTQNYLGKSQFTDPALNATLDDFRIYAQALSSSEITALANPAAGAPTRVAATPGDTQATITWLPNATTSYTVKRSTTSGGPYTTLATGLTGLSYTDTGLTNGTTYYYVVGGTGAQGSTPDSVEVSTIPNTLAVRLKFDESSGTVATDSSGRNFNATLVNGPVFAAGVMSNGLSLTATSSQYATLPAGVVSGMGDFTVATWVKVNAFATWQRIFDFGTGTANYMFLTTQYTTTAPNAAKLRYGIKVNGGTEQNVSGTSIALTAGTWTHVAVTRSGTTVSIYVNGSLAGSGTLTAKPSDLGTTTLNYLGKSQFGSDPYLNASLDEFRIYSRALSSSEIVTMATVLPAPSGLTATAGTGQVALSWNAVSGASGYSVKRATTSGGPYTTIKADNASASYTDTTAVNGTTYYYVVSATNLGGESPASAEASATPLAPPAVPAGLTVLAGNSTISLDWTASTGASSYNVKRATAPGGPYTILASGITGTSYADNDLPSGTTYYYVVSGVNAVAESASSTEVSATTIPASPTGLTTTAGTGQVALSWNAANGASSYTIQRATSANGPYTTIASGVTGTSYADTTALPGWTYYYAISAGNSSGQSDNSASVTITAATAALSWLKLDETSGTTATDATGNANTGTLLNAPTWIGGRIGNALNLNGTNQYASLPASVTANLHDFTVSAWVYWNGGGNWQRIFDFGRGTTVNMFLTPKNATNGNPRFVITTSGAGGEEQINTTSALTTGTWHHIAITLSGSTGTLYIDGQQVGQNTGLTLRPADLGATTQNWIGRSQYTADPYLNGRVDDFRLYAGALSSTEIAALAAPIQTTGLAATGGSAQVALTWTATSGATSYTVRRAATAGGASTVVASGLTGTSYTNTSLAAGTTYYYVVTPANASGDGANSAEASAITAPTAPGNVTATPGNGQVSLSWSASTGATSYSVLRATSPNGSYTTVATGITGTSYTDTGLANGTTYYYAVIAANGSGSSANSTQVNAVTAPPAPTGLSATGSGTQVSLSWTAASGATSYTVKRSTISGGAYTTIASGLTGTSYTNTGLTPGTTYYYVVSATNAAGESANSSEVSGSPVPAAPTGLASSGSGTQISLSWSAASGATAYNVKRSITSGSSYTTVASGVTTTSYTDTGLIAGATYYYVITGTNTAGEGSASAETSTTLVSLAPTGLSAIGWNGAVDLSWTGTGGATSYKVKRATTSGGSYTTLASSVASTTYSDITAANGTTYYYVVSANNAGGESANSAEASVTFTQPVAYLKFDETSGTSAADASGNNWTGTLVNGPLWSAGRSNNTVDLDGVNDHVTLPTGVVSGLTNFTITLWANLDSLSTWSRLFDFGTGTTVNMFLTPKNGANSKVRFAITTSGSGGEQRIDGTAALPIGGWHHVAVTLSGSTGTLYVDGVQVGQNTAMTLTPSSLGSTTLNRIGRSQYNDSYLMGRIDEFRIYSRALSAAEVASLMNTSPAGLVSAPASLTATAGSGQVALSWSAVSGATSYDVLRTTTSGGVYLDVATGLTTTTYTNTGLTAGTTYYYVIVAHTAASESPNSPVASAVAQ